MKRAIQFFIMLLVILAPIEVVAQGVSSDDDIPVVTVKKKYFLKGKRSEFGVHAGIIPNDAFVTSYAVGASYGYHFNELFFFEIPAAIIFNSKSNDTDILESNFGITVDTDDLNYYVEGHLGWTPIYGKINFLGKKIIYLDTSFYIGGGVTDADISGLSPHAVIGIAPRIVLTKWMTLRLDVKDALIFRDDTGVDSSRRNILYVLLGLDFFFPLR